MNIPFLCQNTAAIYKGNVSLSAVYQMHRQDHGLEQRRVRTVCWISTPCSLNPLLGTVSCRLDRQTPLKGIRTQFHDWGPWWIITWQSYKFLSQKMSQVVKRKESFSRVGRTWDKQKQKKRYKPKHTGFFMSLSGTWTSVLWVKSKVCYHPPVILVSGEK